MSAPDTIIRNGQRITRPAAEAADRFQAARRQLDRANRAVRRRKWGTAAFATVVAVLFAFVLGQNAGQAEKDRELQTLGEGRDRKIAAIQQDLKSVCRSVSDSALPTAAEAKCFKAELQPAPAVPAAPDVSDAELLRAVKEKTDAYLARHPEASASDLLPLVRRVVRANLPPPGERGERGQPGENPSDAVLLGLIQQVYVANPPRNGADATQGQADAAIAFYCAAQPGGTCVGGDGAKGDSGPAGRGVVSRDYVLTEPGCVERTTYTAEPSPVDIPVGAALCEDQPPPSEPQEPLPPN